MTLHLEPPRKPSGGSVPAPAIAVADLSMTSPPVPHRQGTALGIMASALEAAVATVRLAGAEPDETARWEMSRKIIAAARCGETSLQKLTESALDTFSISTR